MRKNGESSGDMMYPHDEHHEDEEIEVPLESKISKILSERTTKIVIILVLLMLFFQPVFTVETYVDTPAASD
jgi:hypothetical protein